MLADILVRRIAPSYLLATFFEKFNVFFQDYLFKLNNELCQRVNIKVLNYALCRLIFIFIIFLCIFSSFGVADTEICSFASSQSSCGLYDCGGNSWYIDRTIGHPAAPSLHSGAIQSGGESIICKNVTGPATINFWWRIDGIGSNLGALHFFVDGKKKYMCKSVEGENRSYTIRSDGNHTISWVYQKIKSYPEYQGGGWIDSLTIESPIIVEENVSGYSSENQTNPMLTSFNPQIITINATSIFINSSNAHLSTDKIETDGINILPNASTIEINSKNMSLNVKDSIKISKINKVDIDKIEDLNSNRSMRIDLIEPRNKTFKINDSITFKYIFYPNYKNRFINRCSICINDKEEVGNNISNPDEENVYSLDYRISKDLLGNNKWYVRCYDNISGIYVSKEQLNFTVYLDSNLINVTNEIEPTNNYSFNSIVEAIYYAPPNSTVKVYKENNDEHIIINKSINLIGMNNSTISNSRDDAEVILINNGSSLSIKGFNIIENSTLITQMAINIAENELCQVIIDNNRITGAIKAEGIKNITLSNNIITKNAIKNGIHIRRCSRYSILNNSINGTGNVGLFIDDCSFESIYNITKNNISGMTTGIKICTPLYDGEDLINENIRKNNSLFGFSSGYDVRFVC